MNGAVNSAAEAPDAAHGTATAVAPDYDNFVELADREIQVRIIPRLELRRLTPLWCDLVENSVEQNPFYAPWMLLPALDCLGEEQVKVVCVFAKAGSTHQLVGLAPLAAENTYAHLPIPILKTWMYEHCFFGCPLVRRGYEKAVLEVLFRQIEIQQARPMLLRFSHLRIGGEVETAIKRLALEERRFCWGTKKYQRAELRGPINATDYIGQNIRKKKRKELNRLRNRLSEIGDVSFFRLEKKEDIDRWCKLFLTLEASGWKGEEKSALASKSNSSAFFTNVIKDAFDCGALRFFRLDVGERAIAMIVNFSTNGEAHSFKICHDEEFSRFSPGVLLELEFLRALEEEPEFSFIDSCAAADHSMINIHTCSRTS